MSRLSTAIAGPRWQAFSPRTDHHIEPREGRDLGLWMDWYLKGGAPWPKPPAVRLTLDPDGVPVAVVVPDAPSDVTQVAAYSALGDTRPQARFWRTAEVRRCGNEWRARLPVLDTWDDLRTFANVTYQGGVCLSTPLAATIPAQLGQAKATLHWQPALEQGSGVVDHWKFLGAYTDPSVDWEFLTSGWDAQVGRFVGFNTARLGDPVPVQLYSHILGDPQFQGREGFALAFQVRGEFSNEGLTLTVIEGDRSLRARTYTALVPKKALAAGWREVVLPLSRFLDKNGRAPGRWQDLDKLEVRGKASRRDPPQFARLRWVKLRAGGPTNDAP